MNHTIKSITVPLTDENSFDQITDSRGTVIGLVRASVAEEVCWRVDTHGKFRATALSQSKGGE